MNDPIQSRIDFETDTLKEATDTLKTAHYFDADDQTFFTPLENEEDQAIQEGEIEALMNDALQPKHTFWWRLIQIALAIFVISLIAKLGFWLYSSWQHQDWIELASAIGGGLIVIAGVGSLITEWWRLYRLRSRAHSREIAEALLLSHGMGQGRAFCDALVKQSALPDHHPAVQQWKATVNAAHNDREVITLYSQMVQPILDEQARKAINRSAAESAVMIAVSPFAVVDMAFIAWRNIRLINRIAAIYGIELGYYSRLRLFKMVLLNMACAGAAELISDVGMDWLSQDITARLSARAAQGIGAGLLTARLGIKTMALCRPLPWIDDKPRLSDFRKQLIVQLKQATVQKKSSSI